MSQFPPKMAVLRGSALAYSSKTPSLYRLDGANKRDIMYQQEEVNMEEISEFLPQPQGYRILVAAAKVEDKKGNIYLPDQLRELEDTASIIGCVISMGKDAYGDAKKFPNGPYCEVGDWVLYRSYSGTRFRVGAQEFRMLNDDQVEAVLPDPRKIERI